MNHKCLFITLSVLFFAGSSFAAEPLHPMDKTFIEKAAQGNQAEVKIGELGLKKSSNPQVLKISKHLIHDHGTANQALKKVAEKIDIPLPKQINSEQKETYQKLSHLKGKSFDETFIKVGLEDHIKDATAYQKEIEEGKSNSIKDYASTYLPKIKEHKDLFQQAQQSE